MTSKGNKVIKNSSAKRELLPDLEITTKTKFKISSFVFSRKRKLMQV